MTNLNPTQFFHGTVADIPDAVVPGNQVGQTNYGGAKFGRENEYDEHSDHVYLTPDESTAWDFADMSRQGEPSSRPRVYAAEPQGAVEMGPLHTSLVEHGADEWRSKEPATVKDAIWIRPPLKDEGERQGRLAEFQTAPQQGQLPEVGWDQFYSEEFTETIWDAKTLPGTDRPYAPQFDDAGSDFLRAREYDRLKRGKA